MIPSPTKQAYSEGRASGAPIGFLVGVVAVGILWIVKEACIASLNRPEQCAPFVHVAAFKDGDQTHQVCRTLDGGLEMK